MLARAVEKYIRMSPRKVRYVIDPLRNHTVAEALTLLSVTNRRAGKPVAKAIASAFANAKQVDPTLSEEQAIIRRLFADGGPVWKRHRAAAFGRAVMILKRTTHITVELDRAISTAPRIEPPRHTKPGIVKRKSDAKPRGHRPVARTTRKKQAVASTATKA